jgi:DNA polymerase
MDSGMRNRIRLWLRGERAFGLRAVSFSSANAVESGETIEVVKTVESIEAVAISALRSMPETGAGAARRSQAPQTPAPVGRVQPVSAGEADSTPFPVAAPGGLMRPPSTEPFSAPALAREVKIERLRALDEQEVTGCTRCILCRTRTNTVFGEGDPDAAIMFIGEGPGEDEDLSGRPFVGRSGEKLNGMIRAMGLRREQVFIANFVKCRPPNNRVPAPVEVATCTPYLERQIEIIRPRVIVTLGLPAAKYMLNDSSLSMGRIRGQWRLWRGIKLMPTYHPAYLLRSYTQANRAAVWSDLQQVMAEVGLEAPSKR